jgi:hypothetical protein
MTVRVSTVAGPVDGGMRLHPVAAITVDATMRIRALREIAIIRCLFGVCAEMLREVERILACSYGFGAHSIAANPSQATVVADRPR